MNIRNVIIVWLLILATLTLVWVLFVQIGDSSVMPEPAPSPPAWCADPELIVSRLDHILCGTKP